MAYQNALGEFIVDQSRDDWPKHLRYIERKPKPSAKGEFNPWERANEQRIWIAEQEAWKQIQPLLQEYTKVEKRLRYLISYYNGHVKEFERLTGKDPGPYPKELKYGINVIFPIFSIANFSFLDTIIGSIYNILGGSVQKRRRQRRLEELTRNIETSAKEIGVLQPKLPEIQEKINTWLQFAKGVHLLKAQELEYGKQQVLKKKSREQEEAVSHQQEVLRIRQRLPFQLQYTRPSDL